MQQTFSYSSDNNSDASQHAAVLVSLQQLRDSSTSRLKKGFDESSPPRGGGGGEGAAEGTGNTTDPSWTVPVVKKVWSLASPPSHLLPAASGSGSSVMEDPRMTALEREVESRRAAMTRLESENLSLLREITQWKLQEESRVKQLVEEYNREMQTLRERLRSVAEDQQKESQRQTVARDETVVESNRREQETILLMQRKLQSKDEEIAALQRRTVALEEQSRVVHADATSEAKHFAGRAEGLQSLLHEKEESLAASTRATEQLRRQIDEKNLEISRLRRELENLNVQLSNVGDELTEKSGKADVNSRTIDDMRRRLETHREEASMREAQWLDQEMKLNETIQHLKDDARNVQRDLESARRTVDQLQGEGSTYAEERSKLEFEITELREREARCQHLLAQKQNESNAASVVEEKIRTSFQELSEQYQRLESDYFALSKEHVASTVSLQILKDESTAKSESQAIRIAALEDSVNTAKGNATRIQKELEAERAHSEELQRRLDIANERLNNEDALHTRIQTLDYERGRALQALQEQQTQYMESIRKIAKMEKDAERDAVARAQQQSERDEMAETLMRLTGEISSLRQQASMKPLLEGRIAELDDVLRSKHEELQILTVAYEELRHHTLQLQEELQHVPKFEASARAIMDEKRQLMQQLEHATVSLLSEREAVARISTSYDGATKRLREVQDELAQRIAEVAKSKLIEQELKETKNNVIALERQLSDLQLSIHHVEIEKSNLFVETQNLRKHAQKESTTIEELRDQLQRTTTLLSETQVNLGKLEVRDEDLQKINDRLRTENESLAVESIEQRREIGHLKESLLACQVELSAARSNAASLEDAIQSSKEETSNLRSQLEDSRQLIQSSTSRLNVAEEKNATLEARAMSTAILEARIRTQQQLLDAKARENETLQNDVSTLRESLSLAEKSAAVRKALEDTIEQLRRSQQKSQDDVQGLVNEKEQLTRKQAAIEAEKISLIRESKRLGDLLSTEHKRNDTLQEEVQALERSVKSKSSVEGKFQALTEINEQLREQLTKARQELAEAQLRDKSDRNTSDAIREVQSELRQVKAILEGKESHIRSLEEEMEKKTSFGHNLRRELQTKESQVAQLNERLQEANRALQMLTREREDAVKNSQGHERTKLEAHERALIDEHRASTMKSELEESLRQLQLRLQSQMTKSAEQEDLIHDLRTQLQQVEVSRAKLQMDNDILLTRFSEVNTQLEHCHHRIHQLQLQAANDNATIAERDKIVALMQSNHAAELQSRDEDVNALAVMIEDIKRSSTSVKQSGIGWQSEREELLRTIDSSENLIHSLRREVSSQSEALKMMRVNQESSPSRTTIHGVSSSEINGGLSPVRIPSASAADSEAALIRQKLDLVESKYADEQRRHRQLQDQHDQLVLSVDAVKKTFAAREAALTQDVKELRRHVQLLSDEKERLRLQLMSAQKKQ